MIEQIKIPFYNDDRGRVFWLDPPPIEIRRIFWISCVPLDGTRGNHAHRTCTQVLIPQAGFFRIRITEPGTLKLQTVWSKMESAVVVPPMHWILLDRFSPDAVCLVLASEKHSNPISDWKEWTDLCGQSH